MPLLPPFSFHYFRGVSAVAEEREKEEESRESSRKRVQECSGVRCRYAAYAILFDY